MNTVLSEIENFRPADGNWRPLDSLLGELWSLGVQAEHLPSLFGVFERFPTEDGAGVLWSIVHGVEALPFEYESELRRSLQRTRSLMGGAMLQRLEKERLAPNPSFKRTPDGVA